ncbi:MAG: phytoene/squalene synthase family protein [Kineosporiaceae bacterium]|nr:phytoene/squalene synthase family protein [Kineosporiaceae bacterium]
MAPVSKRALDAAGISDPQLRADYETCRRLNRDHGRTYYLSTTLLPPEKRPYVWALYGFARRADEFVDAMAVPDAVALIDWGRTFLDILAPGAAVGAATSGSPSGSAAPHTTDPVARAMAHTMRRWSIPRAHVEAFLESMQMDLTVNAYPTYTDLEQYMYGSAAVIGLQMLPVLEPMAPEASARARALGEAFQMTNFIRDLGEDLTLRGRVYLPAEDLEVFGVSREILAAGVITPPVRELLRFEIDRTRALYAFAEPGINMVHPTSRDCLRTAFLLYRGILDEVEANHYQVLTQRVAVPLRRRLKVAAPAWRRARTARREQLRWQAA